MLVEKSENVKDLPEDLKRLLENPGTTPPQEIEARLAAAGYCGYSRVHVMPDNPNRPTCTSSVCSRFAGHTGEHICFSGHNM